MPCSLSARDRPWQGTTAESQPERPRRPARPLIGVIRVRWDAMMTTGGMDAVAEIVHNDTVHYSQGAMWQVRQLERALLCSSDRERGQSGRLVREAGTKS